MASYIPKHVTEVLIGSRNDADFETMLDDFLNRMQNVDKKLSVQTQKIVQTSYGLRRPKRATGN